MNLVTECARPRPELEKIRRDIDAGVDWKTVLSFAQMHRLGPLVASRTKASGAMVPEPIREKLDSIFHAGMQRNLRIAAQLVKVNRILQENRIRAAFFKGVAVAATAYDNLAFRIAGDIDVLVPPESREAAISALRNSGYSLCSPDLDADFRVGYETSLASASGTARVDLHWTARPPYFLRFDASDLWEKIELVEIAGHRVPTFCPSHLLCYLALHGGAHCWSSLHLVCDLAHLLERRPDDAEAAIRLAERSRTARAVLVALLLTHDIFGTSLPSEVIGRARGDRSVGRIVASVRRNLMRGTMNSGWDPVIRFQLAEGLEAKFRYLFHRGFVPAHMDVGSPLLPYSIRPARVVLRPLTYIIKASAFSARRLLSPRGVSKRSL